MFSSYLDAVRRPDQTVNPLFAHMGMIVETLEQGRAVLALPFRSGFHQGAGNVAGGVQALIMDEAMAHAVLTTLADGEQTVTMDLHMRYLAPARNEDLRAEAKVVRRGGRVVVVEGEVTGGSGMTVSLATASFLIVRDSKKASG